MNQAASLICGNCRGLHPDHWICQHAAKRMSPENSMELVKNQRDAWRAACRRLYDAVNEGGSKGRPMDLIGKLDWHQVVYLIGHAEELEGRRE